MIRAFVIASAGLALLLGGGTAVTIFVVAQPVSASSAFVKPLQRAVVTQGFGCTSYSFEPVDASCPGGHWHSGIDLAAAWGTDVHATLPGVVAGVSVSATGYGIHVVLDHGGGLTSLYAHLSSVAVSAGELVAAGEVIGAVGSTGNSSGPHLHFEIRRDGVPEDPRADVALS